MEAVTKFESELCLEWNVYASDLQSWHEIIPATGEKIHPARNKPEFFYQASKKQFDLWSQYAKILKAGLTIKQLQELLQKDNDGKLLESYALLAEECPENVTPHMLRSYCIVLFYQNRYNQTLTSKQLAQIAGISVETAKRHLIFLQNGANLLRFYTQPPKWEFDFVPKAFFKYYGD